MELRVDELAGVHIAALEEETRLMDSGSGV